MKRLLSVLVVLTLAVGTVYAGDGSLGVPLSFNRTTSLTGGLVPELVGAKASEPIYKTGDSHVSGVITTYRIQNEVKFIRNGTIGWRQGDPLVLDTAVVTDTGIPRLRRFSASTDTNLSTANRAVNIVAIGQNVCDTGRYCVVTWEGTETGVLAGSAWLTGDVLVASPDAFGLIPLRLYVVNRAGTDTGVRDQHAISPVRALSACAAGSRCSVSIRW